MMWRARSASDKTDDWAHWYVTKDTPANYNNTTDALEFVFGFRPARLPFVSRRGAELLAAIVNDAPVLQSGANSNTRTDANDPQT